MIDELIARLPDAWREVATLLAAPIAWVPRLQQTLLAFFLDSSSRWTAAAKLVLLLFPALLGLAALWGTQLSLYTLPFRAARRAFVSTLLLGWWDAARVMWMYWAGLLRLVAVLVGWALSFAYLAVRLLVGLVRETLGAPLAVTRMMTRSYLQPGVPWIAFVMLVVWCALEAAAFTYTLFPMVGTALADMAGADEPPRFVGRILFVLLLMLVMGSFAGLQALVDAVRRREVKFLAQIALVQLLVMSFEVAFLYRALVDSLSPWIERETGARLGLLSATALAACGWAGVRSMTWFLFGRYGTPPLLALMAREPMPNTADLGGYVDRGVKRDWWRPALADLETELAALHHRGDELLEYLALPVLHLLGAALNFATILTSGRPVFTLPFRSLRDVTESREIAAPAHVPTRKQVSA